MRDADVAAGVFKYNDADAAGKPKPQPCYPEPHFAQFVVKRREEEGRARRRQRTLWLTPVIVFAVAVLMNWLGVTIVDDLLDGVLRRRHAH